MVPIRPTKLLLLVAVLVFVGSACLSTYMPTSGSDPLQPTRQETTTMTPTQTGTAPVPDLQGHCRRIISGIAS